MRFMQLVPAQPRPVVEAGESTAPRRPWRRAREVPATAFPGTRDKSRAGSVISFLAHLTLLLLILFWNPPLHTDPNLVELKLGAGGPGPAGGGGGGNHGSGGVRYVRVDPPKPVIAPPVVKPDAVIVPPKLPDPVVIPPLDMPKLSAPTPVEVKIQSPIVGISGGTGNDGTKGNGPGTGGGIGSGAGTGQGSGVGPGTGGGDGTIDAPTPKEMFIPPLPLPKSVKCFHLIAQFDLDERGKMLKPPVFTPTKDGGYNRQLEEQFKTIRWNPATVHGVGTPVKAKGQIVYEFGC